MRDNRPHGEPTFAGGFSVAAPICPSCFPDFLSVRRLEDWGGSREQSLLLPLLRPLAETPNETGPGRVSLGRGSRLSVFPRVAASLSAVNPEQSFSM